VIVFTNIFLEVKFVRESVDLLIVNANEVVTLAGFSNAPAVGPDMEKLGIIKDGGIAIKDGLIVDVDKTDSLKKKYTSDRIIDAKGNVALPGFVDPHTHLVFSGSREEELTLKLKGATYLDILKKGGGILKTVRLTRAASKEDLVKDVLSRLDTMIIHGTTTVEAKTGYGLNTKDELKLLEVLELANKEHPVTVIPTFLGAHAIPPEYKDDPHSYVNLIIEETLPKVAEQNIAKFNDVFCEKDVFNIEQSRRILLRGKEFGLTPKVHADELTQLGGAELAAEVNAISADHLLYASDSGLQAMKESGTVGVLLPATSLTIFSEKYANARKMIQMGLPIALATDFNPNCWTENLQFIMTLGCYKMKMTPAEVITATTINAAHAIGLGDKIGSIEKGKQADIVVLDIPNHQFIGYKFGINLVKHVIKSGRITVENGNLSLEI